MEGLDSPPSFKCNLLCESLSVVSQSIPCATLKRRGSWVPGNLCISLVVPYRTGYATDLHVPEQHEEQVEDLDSPPSFKCNVQRESLSVDS